MHEEISQILIIMNNNKAYENTVIFLSKSLVIPEPKYFFGFWNNYFPIY